MPFAPTLNLKSAARATNHTELKTMKIQGQSHQYPQAKLGRRMVSLMLLA
jgi:hypothetical protein